jgi:Ca2+-binding RTX toxin-like protein
MVKVIAKQPLNEAALEELGLLLDPADVDFSNAGTKGFTAEADDVRIEVKGSGFKYVPFTDIPQAGTIAGVKVFLADALAYQLKDADIEIKQLAGASDAEAAIRKILSGKDTFKGSSGDDVFSAAAKNDKLEGKGGDDDLRGDGGKDELDGGTGDDILNGGSGKDAYLFKDAPGSGVDTIVKFQSGEKFKVSKSDFAGLSKGPLSDSQFVEGTEAADGNDRFIYDSATGSVYHDADGTGSAAQTLFAIIDEGGGNFGAGSILVI